MHTLVGSFTERLFLTFGGICVAPIGKAIVYWIGCINAIKSTFPENFIRISLYVFELFYKETHATNNIASLADVDMVINVSKTFLTQTQKFVKNL